MLTELHIENVAVIEKSDICFAPGLNILTGETGAGKSILIDALQAVLGGRTSRELVRTGAPFCLVSAVFDAAGTANWQEENGITDENGQLFLLRRITAEGKSTCRVNGVAVTAAQLQRLGALLLDIHGQNDGRQLLDERQHLTYLDRFGTPPELLSRWQTAWQALRDTQRQIETLEREAAEKDRLTEQLEQTVAELEQAELNPGEEEELSARRDLMKNAGRLTEAMDEAYACLYAGDSAAISRADEAGAWLQRAAGWSDTLAEAEKSVREAGFLLQDAAERIRDLRGELDFSPEEYDRLERRLALLKKLQKRYGRDEAGLVALLEESRERLETLSFSQERLERLRGELDKRLAAAKTAAKALHTARKAAGETLQQRIEGQLKELCMPSVRFQVHFAPLPGALGLDATGGDDVCFLMSANAGEKPGRISRIASGGELSRIMLAMKRVFAEKDGVPSLVFDEIDTGVSGIAAQRVGEKLAELSGEKQVLCITHLPQLAVMADAHFAISKTERNGRAYTSVTPLDRAGRREEIARLQGGDHITKATLQAAEDQLAAGDAYKAAHRKK